MKYIILLLIIGIYPCNWGAGKCVQLKLPVIDTIKLQGKHHRLVYGVPGHTLRKQNKDITNILNVLNTMDKVVNEDAEDISEDF